MEIKIVRSLFHNKEMMAENFNFINFCMLKIYEIYRFMKNIILF